MLISVESLRNTSLSPTPKHGSPELEYGYRKHVLASQLSGQVVSLGVFKFAAVDNDVVAAAASSSSSASWVGFGGGFNLLHFAGSNSVPPGASWTAADCSTESFMALKISWTSPRI